MARERDTYDMFDREDRGRFGDNESVRSNDDVRSDLAAGRPTSFRDFGFAE